MGDIAIQPVTGKYGYKSHLAPASAYWTLMTPDELTKCRVSDNDRFVNSSGTLDSSASQLFRFAFGDYPTIETLILRHEGWGERYVTGEWLPAGRVLALWNPATTTWVNIATITDESRADSVFSYEATPSVISTYISGGILWEMYTVTGSSAPMNLYTDLAQAIIGVPDTLRISTAHTPFGQTVRVFDDGDAGAVSFERLDLASGAWSTPTQPFGEGSNSPDIECLADGRLRCALIDSDGNKQQFYSSDDGESWS